jgi:hypothetical protein
MDWIQQPDVLRILFALLSIVTTLSGVYAYRAQKSADAAHIHAEAAVLEAQTAKVDAETRSTTLDAIKVLAQLQATNADNDRAERELRRTQIEAQNNAMMQIATNMNAFMQENISGRAGAVKQVSDTLTAEIQANRAAIVGGFENLETWLDAIAAGIEEMRGSLHKIVTLVQQPPALAPAPETLQLPVPPDPNGEPPPAAELPAA